MSDSDYEETFLILFFVGLSIIFFILFVVLFKRCIRRNSEESLTKSILWDIGFRPQSAMPIHHPRGRISIGPTQFSYRYNRRSNVHIPFGRISSGWTSKPYSYSSDVAFDDSSRPSSLNITTSANFLPGTSNNEENVASSSLLPNALPNVLESVKEEDEHSIEVDPPCYDSLNLKH